MRRISLCLVVMVTLSLALSGCYSKKEYMAKADALVDAEKKNEALRAENAAVKKERDTLANTVKTLQADRTELKKNVVELQKKEVQIETESKTYKDLTKEMQAEIAKGQITISELKGKLTLDVVDKILFASGDAAVKKEGLEVLSRVVDILKKVKDKAIRVEGHTDNIKIAGRLAKTYPTNWELSAARAINVTKYLQQEGIEAQLLSAVAYGEFRPLADNGTAEGRAKNRRIAIVLVPKD